MGDERPAPAPADVAERPTRVRYLVVAAGCTFAVLLYIHRVGFANALPELKLDRQDASRLGAAFLFAYAAFEIPFGMLSDRFGARFLLPLLIVGWSVSTALVAVAPVFPTEFVVPYLLANRFMFGLWQSGAFPTLSRVMADWVPRSRRGTVQGFVWMSSRAGGAAAPLLVVWLIADLGGWRPAVVWLSVIGLVWAGLFYPWFRNRPAEKRGVNAAEVQLIEAGRVAGDGGHGGVPWGKLLRSRSVWGLCLMYAAGGFGSNFYVTLLPTYLRDVRGLTADEAKWVGTLAFGCGVVACLGGGLLSDFMIRRTGSRKWGRRAFAMAGLAVASGGWLLVPQASGFWGLALVFTLIFVANDINMGPAWASCADVGEKYAGTVGGAMNMLGNCSGAFGNLVAGELFNAGRSDELFVLFAVGYGLSVGCWLLVDVTRPVTAGRH